MKLLIVVSKSLSKNSNFGSDLWTKNFIVMNKKIYSLVLIAALSLAFLTSCVDEDVCKNCSVVTYETGTSTVVDRQSAIEYCGDDLFLKENTQPVVSGNDSVVWECN